MPIAEICEAEGFSRVGLWTVNNSCSCRCPVDTCRQLARTLPCCDRTNNSGEWLPAESWELNSVESDRNERKISFKSCSADVSRWKNEPGCSSKSTKSCLSIWSLLWQICRAKQWMTEICLMPESCHRYVIVNPYHNTWKNFFLYQSIPSRHESKEQWFEHRWDLWLSMPGSRSELSKYLMNIASTSWITHPH